MWSADNHNVITQKLIQDNNVEHLQRLGQQDQMAKAILKSFLDGVRGSLIACANGEGSGSIPTDKSIELKRALDYYKNTLGFNISVGIGMSLKDANVALKVAKKRGGNCSLLFTPNLPKELEEKEESTLGLSKSESNPVHDRLLHHANMQKEKDQSEEQKDQLKQGIIDILKKVKNQAPQLAQLKVSNPDTYESLTQSLQVMIGMAQELMGDQVAKGDVIGDLPVGARKGQKILVENAKTGRKNWHSVKAGMVANPVDGTPLSIKELNTAKQKALQQAPTVPDPSVSAAPQDSQVEKVK